jgi:fibulin 1/2
MKFVTVFIDVDECSTYENGCSYNGGCQNTIGNYTCTCLAGYYLDADMRTCKGIIIK